MLQVRRAWFRVFCQLTRGPPPVRMLTLVLWIVVLAVVFAICHQGARTLATHHADAREAIATVMIGASVLAVVALVNSERLPGGSVALWMLAFAVSGGLYAGYERIDV